MSALQRDPGSGGDRFPRFAVIEQSSHWDEATRRVVETRMQLSDDGLAFFSESEAETATALFNQLLDLSGEPRVPVMRMVDSRLAAGETDGWRYEGMDEDGQSWRLSLGWLDEDAAQLGQTSFARSSAADQVIVIERMQQLGPNRWHGIPASHIWSLWTRYACTAFYSHPFAWQEIGFPGPAYPRGYKNIGIDRREPFEVADQHPDLGDAWAPTS